MKLLGATYDSFCCGRSRLLNVRALKKKFLSVFSYNVLKRYAGWIVSSLQSLMVSSSWWSRKFYFNY